MNKRFVSKHDEPLTSEDLDTCQRAFEVVIKNLNVDRDAEEGQRAAAIVIELYRQGLRDEVQLAELASSARGRNLSQGNKGQIASPISQEK